MKTLNLLFLSFLCLFMTACLDPIDIESNIPEEVITPQATNICSRSVQLNVEFYDAFVLLGTSPNISENNALKKFNYTSIVNDLTPNTTYYYKMIRRRGGYDLDGDVKSFTTTIEVGSVTISSVYSGPSESEQPIIYSDLVLNGANIKETGFCFSQKTERPTINNCDKKVVTNMNSKNRLESKACLENGVKGMITYVKAYVITDQDTIYSENSNHFYLVSGFKDGYPYIDLGLPSGLKWAVCNDNMINEPRQCGSMTPDILLYKKNWGEKWRLPTYEDALEFAANCKQINTFSYWDITFGSLIEGKNGNVIYMPCGGCRNSKYQLFESNETGYFWLSSKSNVNDKCYRVLIINRNGVFSTNYYMYEGSYAHIRYVTE